jgi:hypothetical protein
MGMLCARYSKTGVMRTSGNATSRYLGEAYSAVPHPPKLRHTDQTLNARGFAYAACRAPQPLVARQAKDEALG